MTNTHSRYPEEDRMKGILADLRNEDRQAKVKTDAGKGGLNPDTEAVGTQVAQTMESVDERQAAVVEGPRTVDEALKGISEFFDLKQSGSMRVVMRRWEDTVIAMLTQGNIAERDAFWEKLFNGAAFDGQLAQQIFVKLRTDSRFEVRDCSLELAKRRLAALEAYSRREGYDSAGNIGYTDENILCPRPPRSNPRPWEGNPPGNE